MCFSCIFKIPSTKVAVQLSPCPSTVMVGLCRPPIFLTSFQMCCVFPFTLSVFRLAICVFRLYSYSFLCLDFLRFGSRGIILGYSALVIKIRDIGDVVFYFKLSRSSIVGFSLLRLNIYPHL